MSASAFLAATVDDLPTVVFANMVDETGSNFGNPHGTPAPNPGDWLFPRRDPNRKVPPVVLAGVYDRHDVNPEGWWVSEKFDGVRAWWDGKQLVTRAGNVIAAPDWFTAGLPVEVLDGELWGGRGTFAQTSGVVRRKKGGDDWKYVSFCVFDAPEQPGGFEQRQQWLQDWFSGHDHPHARLVEQVRCEGREDLITRLRVMEARGGEGLMLRRPESSYYAQRGANMLKVKCRTDADAEVIGYKLGSGRNARRVGALRVQMDDGTVLLVGTGLTDLDRTQPPAIGHRILFAYEGVTDNGIPRHPRYLGARAD